MKELHIDAKPENLDAVLAFIEAELASVPDKVLSQIAIAAEEIFVNIAHYAYAPETGGAVVRVRSGGEITIEFEDGGKPYNPLAKEDPDVTLGAEERKIGGLGVYMVKKMMDSVEYRRDNGKNIFCFKKSTL
ncbi:MAG: ATP-binding protein [Oscillospiraceae bacterium]|nr:ATP-binding protein [Oscillospiraceae bacterium]